MLYELMTRALPYTLKRNTTGAIEGAILAMLGRHHEAEDVLLHAPTFSDLKGDPVAQDSRQYSRVIPETLARVRLNAENIRGAREILPATAPKEHGIGMGPTTKRVAKSAAPLAIA